MRAPMNAPLPAVVRLLDAVGEAAAVRILEGVARPGALRVLAVEVQTRHALRLLCAGEPRSVIRDRLRAAHEIGWQTAYDRINAALDRRMSRIARP